MRLASLPLFLAIACMAVVPAAAQAQPPDAPGEAATLFDHPDNTRWWLSGQLNLITQWHGRFTSPYDGPHSLQADPERATSRLWTIFTGYRLAEHTEVFVNVEAAGGRGISSALGLAGFTNLDVVRNPDLGSAPYLGRTLVRQIFAIGEKRTAIARGPFSLASSVPARRIEIWAGKMTLADFFDVNGPGSDSHLQFTNWTVDNNGAWDYAADTRGYTLGVLGEIVWPAWTLRVGEALMPTVANGLSLDWDLRHAGGTNVEYEARLPHGLISRTLGFVNRAAMGSYAEANAASLVSGEPPAIEATRVHGRTKAGIAENLEVPAGTSVRLFGRAGWNDGRNESFAYTEVDNTVSAGGDVLGHAWRRDTDRIGIAAVSNGLSSGHREYLRLGGQGFLLGDGALHYGRETIIEAYYNAHLWRGVFAAAGLQHINAPGYNRDRGPVTVGSARVHVDF